LQLKAEELVEHRSFDDGCSIHKTNFWFVGLGKGIDESGIGFEFEPIAKRLLVRVFKTF
jgi:hypothetical protein